MCHQPLISRIGIISFSRAGIAPRLFGDRGPMGTPSNEIFYAQEHTRSACNSSMLTASHRNCHRPPPAVALSDLQNSEVRAVRLNGMSCNPGAVCNPPDSLIQKVTTMKFAICQELYENTDWATQCRLIAEAGYTGIEVAPFTISTDLASVPAPVFHEMKQEAARHGLEIIGLHWLLARTNGLYLTSPEPTGRAYPGFRISAATHAAAGNLAGPGGRICRRCLPPGGTGVRRQPGSAVS
jgi:hypothetical protein